MGTLNDSRCVQKHTKQTGYPNAELASAAVAARRANYTSYGKMQAAAYAARYTSDIKKTIEKKRRDGEYRTVRERMEEAARNRIHTE